MQILVDQRTRWQSQRTVAHRTICDNRSTLTGSQRATTKVMNEWGGQQNRYTATTAPEKPSLTRQFERFRWLNVLQRR
jgi:hypothetical protein